MYPIWLTVYVLLCLRFKWLDVGVLDYNPKTKLYFVRAVGFGGIQHNFIPKGTQLNAFVMRDSEKLSALSLPSALTIEGCWIPRVRLMFCAEDPQVCDLFSTCEMIYVLLCVIGLSLRRNHNLKKPETARTSGLGRLTWSDILLKFWKVTFNYSSKELNFLITVQIRTNLTLTGSNKIKIKIKTSEAKASKA